MGHKVRLPVDLDPTRRCASPLREGGASLRGWVLKLGFEGLEEIASVGPAVLFRGLLEGIAVTFIVDSGSQVNLVSQGFCEANPILRIREDDTRLHFGNGQEASTTGALSRVTLSCQGRKAVLSRVCISPHSLGSVDLLLGTPFLQEAGAGVFSDPVPRVSFPKGAGWHSEAGLGGFNRDEADVKFVQGNSAKQFLKQTKGDLDVFALRVAVGKDGSIKSSAATQINGSSEVPELVEELKSAQEEFADVLRDQLPGPEERAGADFLQESVLEIPLKPDAVPRRYRPIPLSAGEALVMEELLGELMEKAFIEEGDGTCGWSAPVFLLKKPGRTGIANNRFRLLCDLRGVNAQVVPESYFPADVAQIMRDLSGAKVFSSFDFLNGYSQMALHPNSRDITTFSVHLPGKGLRYFRYKSVVLGLQNSVGRFQTWAERVTAGLSGENGRVQVYIDDCLLSSGDVGRHVDLVVAFLLRCRRYKVYLARTKSHWGVVSLDFLGFRVSEDCVEVSQSKKQALQDYAVPNSYAATRRFVGFCVYLSQHVDHFSGRIAPLTTLLKGDVKGPGRVRFVWSPACQVAFEDIKEAILQASGLFIPTSDGRFSIECDASGMGVGAALFQTVEGVLRPVWFASHKLSKAERNYAPRSLEMLAVIFSLKKFRGYIALHHVHIFSDHESLAGFLKQQSLQGRDARWAELLLEQRFSQFYRRGETMLVADALSRAFVDMPSADQGAVGANDAAGGVTDFINENIAPHFNRFHQCDSADVLTVSAVVEDSLSAPAVVDKDWRAGVLKLVERDPELVPILAALKKDVSQLSMVERASVRHFALLGDGLYFLEGGAGPRLVIPKVPGDRTRTLLLFQAHDSSLHPGVERTYAALSRTFFWIGMRASVERFVRSCLGCQERKSKNARAEGFRGGHSVPPARWHTVAIDFITDLEPDAEGFDQILVVMDVLTKFVYLVPCLKTDSAETTAKRLFAQVFCVHGAPVVLQSDRDTKFCSAFFSQLMVCFNVRQAMGGAYDHRWNGIVENMNRQVECLLRSVLAHHKDRAFTEYLPLVAFSLNSAVHSSTKMSPYFAMFGVEPCNPVLFAGGESAAARDGDVQSELSRIWCLFRRVFWRWFVTICWRFNGPWACTRIGCNATWSSRSVRRCGLTQLTFRPSILHGRRGNCGTRSLAPLKC